MEVNRIWIHWGPEDEDQTTLYADYSQVIAELRAKKFKLIAPCRNCCGGRGCSAHANIYTRGTERILVIKEE